MVISKLIDKISKILLIFIACSIIFFIFMNNSLENPDTMDIRIISGMILILILINILKYIFKKK